jgi:hypothetical protein
VADVAGVGGLKVVSRDDVALAAPLPGSSQTQQTTLNFGGRE